MVISNHSSRPPSCSYYYVVHVIARIPTHATSWLCSLVNTMTVFTRGHSRCTWSVSQTRVNPMYLQWQSPHDIGLAIANMVAADNTLVIEYHLEKVEEHPPTLDLQKTHVANEAAKMNDLYVVRSMVRHGVKDWDEMLTNVQRPRTHGRMYAHGDQRLVRSGGHFSTVQLCLRNGHSIFGLHCVELGCSRCTRRDCILPRSSNESDQDVMPSREKLGELVQWNWRSGPRVNYFYVFPWLHEITIAPIRIMYGCRWWHLLDNKYGDPSQNKLLGSLWFRILSD
jgi:hypothetical protein